MGPVPPEGFGSGANLTSSERRVLGLLAAGLTCENASKQLGVSPCTVREQLRCVCAKLQVSTPMQAVVLAARYGAL